MTRKMERKVNLKASSYGGRKGGRARTWAKTQANRENATKPRPSARRPRKAVTTVCAVTGACPRCGKPMAINGYTDMDWPSPPWVNATCTDCGHQCPLASPKTPASGARRPNRTR